MTAIASLLHEIIPGWTLPRARVRERLDAELLVRAYRFSEAAHAGQTRNSGEPFVIALRRGRARSSPTCSSTR